MIVSAPNNKFMVRASGSGPGASLGTYETWSEAEPVDAAATRWLGAARARQHAEPLGALLDRWLEWRVLSGKTEDALADKYARHLRRAVGRTPIPDALVQLHGYANAVARDEQKARASYNRQLFRVAAACDYETPAKPAGKTRAGISQSDITVLLDGARNRFKAEDDWRRLALFLVVGVGMRPSEVLALRWSDVDLRNSNIAVRRAYVSEPTGESVSWLTHEVPAYQCRVVSFGQAAFGLGDEIRGCLEAVAAARVNSKQRPKGVLFPAPSLPVPRDLDDGSEEAQRYCFGELIFTTFHKPPQSRNTPSDQLLPPRWHPITPAKGSLNSAFRRLRDDVFTRSSRGRALKLHDLRYACADATWAAAAETCGSSAGPQDQAAFARQFLGLASATEALRNLNGIRE